MAVTSLITWIRMVIISWPSFTQYVAQFIRRYQGMRFCKVMAIPVLLYGSEIWVPLNTRLTRIHASRMRFLQPIKAAHEVCDGDIYKELKIFNVQHCIAEDLSLIHI